MLHESIKEDDPMKVGRFGLGFKSVFHMTGWDANGNLCAVEILFILM